MTTRRESFSLGKHEHDGVRGSGVAATDREAATRRAGVQERIRHGDVLLGLYDYHGACDAVATSAVD